MELKLEDMVNHLQRLKETQGEDSYKGALQALAKHLLAGDGTTPFLNQLLEALKDTSLDMEALKTEAAEIRKKREEAQEQAEKVNAATGQDMNQVMMDSIRQQLPNLKTQAQFDLVISTFEAITLYLNACYGKDTASAVRLREGINKALDLAPKLGEATEKLSDNPEATTNTDFVEPPKQYTEASSQERLLEELESIDSEASLQEWYAENKSVMDGIVSQNLRNKLFDAIRDKRKEVAH